MPREPRLEDETIWIATVARGSLHRSDIRHQTRLRAPVSAQIHLTLPVYPQFAALRLSEPGDR